MRVKTDRKQKVYGILYGEQNKRADPIVYCKTMEKIALQKYVEEKDENLISHGLVISQEFPFIGASPDGIIVDKDTGEWKGVFEVKCPYSHRNSNRGEMIVNLPSYLQYDKEKDSIN